MTLPASGVISLSDVQTEFGGTNPIGINEYYRGGGLVPNTSVNTNIPTSGQISMSNFYGGSAAQGISFINSSFGGATSVTIPSGTLTNDLIVVFAFRRSSATPPSLASGFTTALSSGASSRSVLIAYKVASSTDAGTSYTFTNASGIACVVYRNVSSVGPSSLVYSNSSVDNPPSWDNGLTMSGYSQSNIVRLDFIGTTGNNSTDVGNSVPNLTNVSSLETLRIVSVNNTNNAVTAAYDSVGINITPITNVPAVYRGSTTWSVFYSWMSATIYLIGPF